MRVGQFVNPGHRIGVTVLSTDEGFEASVRTTS
jgi:hypothetical protein